MTLFNIGKKKEQEMNTPTCACNSAPAAETPSCRCGSAPSAEKVAANCCGSATDGICCVKVLGAGCKTCHEQYEQAKLAMKAMGLSVEVEYITDMPKVMEYGVMSVPAVVVNERVAVQGKLVKAADLEKLLRGMGDKRGGVL